MMGSGIPTIVESGNVYMHLKYKPYNCLVLRIEPRAFAC
jgi:hypothetical protein